MNSETNSEPETMSAMEKVAWTELVVATVAIVVVLVLIPILGHAASSAFGLLGVAICSFWFLRERRKRTIVDERDLEIEQQANQRGIESAWMFLIVALITLVMWPRDSDGNAAFLTKATLNWLIWIQFAIYVGVKGWVGVTQYRRQSRAA